ncbi:hypothetical protein E2C01_088643 [Portunus trituberculatus]|uniref:Uncharacterized protein n=1 Tax=Portunus trituberculatus TaxID=210409 RepID=A0A5B7J6Q5_PORTR|nr:hypothetical protein [Portunus trituberculatus]
MRSSPNIRGLKKEPQMKQKLLAASQIRVTAPYLHSCRDLKELLRSMTFFRRSLVFQSNIT